MLRQLQIVVIGTCYFAACVSAQDRNQNPGGIDPLVQGLLKQTSSKYKEYGFRDWVFGTEITDPKVSEKAGKQEKVQNQSWIDAGDVGLYFDEGKLVAIRRNYNGDVKLYLDAVVEQFGKVADADEQIVRYDGVRSSTGYVISGYTVVKYRFPKTLVYVCVHGENLLVTVFERDYVARLLSNDLVQKRTLFGYLSKIAKYSAQPELDWEKIPFPSIEGTTVKRGTTDLGVRFAMLRGRDAPQYDVYERGQALSVFETNKTGSKEVIVRLDCNPVPTFSSHRLVAFTETWHEDGQGTVQDEALLLTCHLAQRVFSPKGRNITSRSTESPFNTSVLEKVYEWESDDGWTVQVLPGNLVVVVKTEKKKL